MTSLTRWAFGAAVILTIPFASQSHAAPSFDCAKASTRVERMICDHPRIAELDSELADAYRIALRDSPWASANRRIREEQKAWIAERNNCRDPRCLRQSYRQRISELRAEVSSGGSGSSNSGGESSTGDADLMQVTGVASNDVLNVRSGPGPNYRIVGALGNGDTVRNLGCQDQGNSRWCEIEMMTDMRERGWVNARFLSVGTATHLPSMPTNDWYTRLPGAADEFSRSQLEINGFYQVDSFSSGANGYGTVWYSRSTGQCLQVITVNGRVDSAIDIQTHPRCRG